MHTISINGDFPKEMRADLERQVKEYATANPGQLTGDATFQVKGPDGKMVTVEGRYAKHDGILQIVFTVVNIIGLIAKVVKAIKGLRPRDRRIGSRRASNAIDVNLPSDPEGMFRHMVKNKMLVEKKNGTFTMAGGKTFPNKAAVMSMLSQSAAAIADSSAVDARVNAGAAAPAPTRRQARQARRAERKVTPKPAAPKPAAPKKVAKAVKKAVKKAARKK